MKKTRHTEETIIQVLNEARAGGAVAEICRRHGISEASFYKWKQKYGGMEVSEAKGSCDSPRLSPSSLCIIFSEIAPFLIS